MEISPAQLINPGIFEYDDTRRKKIERFKEAVRRAKFLSDDQRKRWKVMGYLLSTQELGEAENLIIAEDLHRLRMQQKLEKLSARGGKEN